MLTPAECDDSAAVARSRSATRVAGVALVFCAVALAFTFTFDSVPGEFMTGLGPALFPRVVLAVMGLLASLMALGIGAPPTELPAPIHRMTWIVGLAMAAYMGAVWLVGMWAASALFLVVVGWLWGERKVLALAVSAAGLCVALYALFVWFLGSVFPAGAFADMLR